MSADLPAITGEQFVALLEKDGWYIEGKTTHGISMQKYINGRHRVAIIPCKSNRSMNPKTLHDILSVKQSGITRAGLKTLIDLHGIS